MRRIIVVVAAIMLVGCSANAASSIAYTDMPTAGIVESGQQLFSESINSAPPCVGCHMPGVAASPDLAGFAARAGESEAAREYAFYSITEPGRTVVEGFGNVMYDQYDEKLTPQQIADLIAYLLTL